MGKFSWCVMRILTCRRHKWGIVVRDVSLNNINTTSLVLFSLFSSSKNTFL